jgi:succinoglycan biosynthesis transport protein ExoP
LKNIEFTNDDGFTNYFFILKKRKYLILSICIISAIIALVHTHNTRPLYQATAQLLIEIYAPKAIDTRDVIQNGDQWDFYRTQYELLKDRSLAKEVIQTLNLENSKYFVGEKPKDKPASPSWTKDLITSIKSALGMEANKQPNKPVLDGHITDPYSPLVDKYLGSLKVEPILNSRLVNISFQGYHPPEIQKIINTMANLYINKSIELRKNVERGAQNWLETKTESLKRELDNKEKNLQNVKGKENIKEIERKRLIAEKKIEQILGRETDISFKRSQVEGLIKEIQKTKNNPLDLFSSLPDSVINDDLSNLKNDYFKLKKEVSNLSKKLGDKHPKMIAAKEQLRNLEDRIPNQIDDLIYSKQIDLKSLLAQENSIKNELRKNKQILSSLDKNYYQNSSIKQDLEGDKNIYEMLSKRLKEIDVASEYNESNIRLVYPAEMPRFPISPNKRQNLLFGIFGGLIVSFFLIYILESANNKIKSIDDVLSKFNFPLMGVVSLFDSKTLPLPTMTDPDSMLAENFRLIATKIIETTKRNSQKVMLVTSSTPEEGKTTVTSNLAFAFAQLGKKVIVLDADFRRPNIHNIMKTAFQPGLSQLLDSKNPKEIMSKWKIKNNPAFFSAGVKSNNPTQTLNSPSFEYAIKLLKNNFDYVLIDTPPVLNISDTSIISQVSDGIIFVLKSNVHDQKLINRALTQLLPDSEQKQINNNPNQNGKMQTKLIGIIMNQYDYKNETQYGYGNYYGKYAKEYFQAAGKVN